MLLNLVTPLHESTKRDYRERLLDNKVEAMIEARKFEENYWDGPRRYGYGGYRYDGRWKPVAQRLIDRYRLGYNSKVLDIGCGKGFLLHDLLQIEPGIRASGIDRSYYAIAHASKFLKEFIPGLLVSKAQDQLRFFGKDEFDLVISFGTLHNLTLSELWRVLPEIERIGKEKYIMVESFRNEQEWYNLTAWCLTAETLMRPEDWEFLFKQTGYTGDYEFIYFQ